MSIETTLKQCRDLYMVTATLGRMFRFCGSFHQTMSQPHWVRWLKCSSEKTSGSDVVGSIGGPSREFPIHMSCYPHLVHMLLAVGSIACYFKSARFDFQRRKEEKLLPFVSTFLGESRHYTRSSPAGPVRFYKQLPASEASDRIPGGHSLPKQRGPNVVPRIKRPGFWIWEWSLKQPGHQNCHTILKVLYRNWCWNSQKGEPTDQWSVSWTQLRMGIEGHHMSSSNSRWIKDELKWSKLFEKLISSHLNLAHRSISHAYAKTHVHRKNHAYVHIYIYINAQKCKSLNIHIYIQKYIYMYIYVY